MTDKDYLKLDLKEARFRIGQLKAEREVAWMEVGKLRAENEALKSDKHVLELLCEGKDLSKDEKDSIICNLRSDIRDLEDGQDELNETNRNLYGVTAELEAKNESLCRKYDALLDEVALLRADKE